MSATLGLGIVGCGGAALDVVWALPRVPTIRLVAAHDHDKARARDLAARAGGDVHVAHSLRALLGDPGVEAVYVAVPHDRLAPTAAAALRAGRHVLVEKPVATTLAGLRRARTAAREASRSVGVMFELRHVAAVAAARELVAAGAIGAATAVRIRTVMDKPATYWSSGPTGRAVDPWRASVRRAGGGVVLMNAVHQLDLVRWITGLEVEAVAAFTAAGIPDVEVEDRAAAVLGFAGGVVGSLTASAHAAGASRDERIEIDGTLGALRLPDPYAGRDESVQLFLRRPWRDQPAGRWLEWRCEAAQDPWAATLASFASAVAAGRDPEPGLDDAEAALATVLAIYRSARTGRRIALDAG